MLLCLCFFCFEAKLELAGYPLFNQSIQSCFVDSWNENFTYITCFLRSISSIPLVERGFKWSLSIHIFRFLCVCLNVKIITANQQINPFPKLFFQSLLSTYRPLFKRDHKISGKNSLIYSESKWFENNHWIKSILGQNLITAQLPLIIHLGSFWVNSSAWPASRDVTTSAF